MAFRTDLAVELLENLRESGKIEGVTETEYEREGLHIHEAEITGEDAARRLGRSCGRYVTLSLAALTAREEEAFPRSAARCCRRFRRTRPCLSRDSAAARSRRTPSGRRFATT